MAIKQGMGAYKHIEGCVYRDPTEQDKCSLKFPRDRFDLLSVDRVVEWPQRRKYKTSKGIVRERIHPMKTVWITVRCKKCGTVKQVADNPRMGCKEGPCNKGFKDWTGKKINRITPVRYVFTSYMRNKKPRWYWECVCDCGRTTLTESSRLALGLKVECDHCARMHNNDRHRLPDDLAVWHRLYRQVKRNAATRNYCFDLSFDEVYAMMARGVCHYCGSGPVDTCSGVKALGLDRVDNDQGYTKENTVPCCGFCNVMKMKHTEKEFLDKVKQIALHRKLTFNDYPEREYTQAGGNGEHLEKGEEIV